MSIDAMLNARSLPIVVHWLRAIILFFVSLLLVLPLSAHTPYAQWDSYRERHLQVLTARSDLLGDSIADKWVAVLAEHLPESRAVVSRARNMIRVSSLLKTDQAKVAVLSYSDAKAMFNGTGDFAEYGPVPLTVLLDDGAYLLVARPDLPHDHGVLITSALLEDGNEFGLLVPKDGKFGIKTHPGALEANDSHILP